MARAQRAKRTAAPPPVPGTIFGTAVARLSEPAYQRRVAGVVGLLLVVIGSAGTRAMSAADTWQYSTWPMLSGVTYLLSGLALGTVRVALSRLILRGCLFVVACASLLIESPLGNLYVAGYTVLVVSLLMRMSRPTDPITRIPIAGAALCLVPAWLDSVRINTGNFQAAAWLRDLSLTQIESFPALYTHNFLLLVVLTLVMSVALAAATRGAWPGRAAGTVITAVLMLWLPLEKTLLMQVGGPLGGAGLWQALAHGFAPIAANVAILIMLCPTVYGSLRGGERLSPG